MTRHPSLPLCRLASCLLAAFASGAQAAPAGGVVAAGSASISTSGKSTTITQTSQSTSINWQGFGIAAGESVQFKQPGASSVALNRVLGADPSAIFGNLSANGRVFLVNPNGILFGSGSSVNVGGLVASTLSISDADFMAGRYTFSGTSRAAVVNNGDIRADGGYVALLGAQVANDGSIRANGGSVALAAGQALTLDMAGDKLLNVTVDRGAVDAMVRNGGLIQADGGQVLMTTQAAGNLLSTVVNNTGIIQARTIGIDRGVIRLLGDMQSGTVSISGVLDVSGSGAGQAGGTVIATAHHVGVFGGTINASGTAGGGTVLIGGDFQGSNPDVVPAAAAAYVSSDSVINADATVQGNGGKVIVWSTDSTRARGALSARGGAQGGDGGLIETSGHVLDVDGIRIDASAAAGKHGLWLLDPADITISTGATTGAAEPPPGGVYSPNSGVSSSHIDVAVLATTLGVGANGTDVTITTTNTGAVGGGVGDITISSALAWSPTNHTTLTLNAAHDVNINAPVTATRGNLVVCCGNDINVNAPVTTTNGSILLSAGRNINLVRSAGTLLLPSKNTAGITTTDGNIAMCAAQDINLANTFDGAALLTLTRGSVAIGEDLAGLGVARGLTLSAGTGGTGPGPAGGTVNIGAGTILKVTGPAGVAPINIVYNPTSYLTPTDYSGFFATGDGAPLTQRMLVFAAGGDKPFDGTTTAVLSGLKGNPANVTLVAGPGSTANFNTAAAGAGKPVAFSGYTLAGSNAAAFALALNCCGPILAHTTATITPVAPVTPLVAPPLEGTFEQVLPQFAPFVVAPVLLSRPGNLLTVAPPVSSPMALVVVRDEPTPVVAPAPAPAPAPAVAPPVAQPLPAPPVRVPKPFRN